MTISSFMVDRAFEENKLKLINMGIEALKVSIGRIDIDMSNVTKVLYTTDQSTLVKDARDFLVYALDEDVKSVPKMQGRLDACKWLRRHFDLFQKRYPEEVLIYLRKWHWYWTDLMGDMEETKDAPYYKPSVLDWAIYLTVRGPVPLDFPSNSNFTTVIEKWCSIHQYKDWSQRLQGTIVETETRIAKKLGTYSKLKKKREELRAKQTEASRNLQNRPEVQKAFKEAWKLYQKGYEVIWKEKSNGIR